MADDIVTRLRGQRTNGRICEEAAAEIERLRSLLSEILPYMLNDMEQGLNMGPAPEDHVEDAPCPDCQWYEDATLWKKRINAGEFKGFDI